MSAYIVAYSKQEGIRFHKLVPGSKVPQLFAVLPAGYCKSESERPIVIANFPESSKQAVLCDFVERMQTDQLSECLRSTLTSLWETGLIFSHE